MNGQTIFYLREAEVEPLDEEIAALRRVGKGSGRNPGGDARWVLGGGRDRDDSSLGS